MEPELENIERPWDQMPNEPDAWYSVFRTYYLPLGPRRSLRRAFELFLRTEKPERYDIVSQQEKVSRIPAHWPVKARDFEWAKRALAYDEEQLDLTSAQIDQTLAYIRDNAMGSAQALVEALSNERTKVQAANSLLNRAGVPETTEVTVKSTTTITSDDMAAAREQVEKWTSKNKESNG